ncbi:MAG: hypothetical protein WDO56_05735 [Gammaproteobacteria bacterium]
MEKHGQCSKVRICMVCNATYDATQRSLELEADAPTGAGDATVLWGLCPPHEQLHLSGMMFIIEVEIGPEEAARMLLGALTPDGLVRTGRVLTLPVDFIRERIAISLMEDSACVFVPTPMFDYFAMKRRSLQ